jgi:hypothetical protein
VALARPTCLYCGTPLPAPIAPAAGRPGTEVGLPPAPPAAERLLLILDLEAADSSALARVLGLGPFEAEQRRRHGGLHLLRIGEASAIGREAERLAAEGLRVGTVPEGEARVRPEVATGGGPEAGALRLRTGSGPLTLAAPEVFLIVRGPIAREFQPQPKRLRFDTARPDAGYRFHLHRRGDARPVELDPGSFEFGREVVTGSSLLELASWIGRLLPGVPQDDGFRRLPPVLAPAGPERGLLGAARALAAPSAGRRKEARPILDNVEQFRFYSAWRAAYARRRSRP